MKLTGEVFLEAFQISLFASESLSKGVFFCVHFYQDYPLKLRWNVEVFQID